MFDAAADLKWVHRAGDWYRLRPHQPVPDRNGHLVLDYNPGRYNGVIVLAPTETGFADYRSLPVEDDFDARFYSATAVDLGSDGTLEIHRAVNDCIPSCADGAIQHSVEAFDGNDFTPAGNDGANSERWVVSAVGVGPLSIGTTGQEGVARGVAIPTPGALCGRPYELVGEYMRGGDVALVGTYVRGRPVRLAGVLIKGSAFRTAAGIGVGSSQVEVVRTYGERLRKLPVEGFDGRRDRQVLVSDTSALVFYESQGKVLAMELVAYRRGRPLVSTAVGC